MALNYRSLAALSGDFDGDAAGTAANGTAVALRNVEPGTLSAYFDVSATTNTATITGKFQVSNDNSTFIDVAPMNNAANVALTTGTGSAVTGDKVLPVPQEVWGWKYFRGVCVLGGTTGAATETYAVTYRWLHRNPFERVT